MKSVKILSVSKDGTMISVIKQITNDDNSVELNQHFFQEDTLEWRAAEYDTLDQDKLIDSILYSPYMDPKDPELYDHPDSTTARNAHGANMIAIKARLKPPGPDNSATHYQSIKDHSVFDQETIKLKKVHVDKVFEMRNSSQHSNNQDFVTRADKLRQQLPKLPN